MMLSTADFDQLTDLAIQAATEAGQMIARSRPDTVQFKSAESESASLASRVVTEIDRRSERIILETLHPTLERFALGVLSEERNDDGSRLTSDYFWCIDPLDGTLPFIEESAGFAVSIALVRRDGTPQIGVVYDPVGETLWHAISGDGVFRNRRRWRRSPPQAELVSVFADRSFAERDGHDAVVDALQDIAHGLGFEGIRLEPSGGAVMNACGVLAHSAACYFKFPKPAGGGSLWDFAATACLFHETGAVASNLGGGRLDLNRADATNMAHQGVLFATDEALAARIRTHFG